MAKKISVKEIKKRFYDFGETCIAWGQWAKEYAANIKDPGGDDDDVETLDDEGTGGGSNPPPIPPPPPVPPQ